MPIAETPEQLFSKEVTLKVSSDQCNSHSVYKYLFGLIARSNENPLPYLHRVVVGFASNYCKACNRLDYYRWRLGSY